MRSAIILSNDFPLGVNDDIIVLMIVKVESVLKIYNSNITGRVSSVNMV